MGPDWPRRPPGRSRSRSQTEATYRASAVETGLAGSRFTVHGPDGVTELRSPLPGLFNVYNVLGALAAVRALGVSIDTAAAAIETAGNVPGRFEPVDAGQEFAVLVDYAHTPDSLENVLRAAAEARSADGRRSTSCSAAGGTATAASAR